MKSKNLKEYFGTQRPSFAGGPGAGSNFYSGADLGAHTKGRLGTRGADSKFSQRMQAIVPNDYYDLLEDDEKIDEDYVVENSRYSLKNLSVFEAKSGAKRRVILMPEHHQYWINRIQNGINQITNNQSIKKQVENHFNAKKGDNLGDNPKNVWISYIAFLNANFLKSDLVSQNSFNNKLKLPNELMRQVIFEYCNFLAENERVTVGPDSNFPHVVFDIPSKIPKDKDLKILSEKLSRIGEKVFKQELEAMLKKHFDHDDYKNYKKIVLTSGRGNKTLYEKAVEENFQNILRSVKIYLNSERIKNTPTEPAPEPLPRSTATASSSAVTPETALPEPEPGPDLDFDIGLDDDDDAEESDDQPSEVPPTSTATSRLRTTEPAARPSSRPSKENFFDQVFEDPMFDNPFVKLFVKRPGDRQVGLQDFYRYYKDKRKTNESFELSLKNRSLSYLVQENFIDDALDTALDLGTDLAGDVGAAAISTGTFGLTSAALIAKNIYELKETSKKADIALEAFLLNPSDKTCENIEKILNDIITDFIDLVQRTIEAIPDPAGEAGTVTASVIQNIAKAAQFLKGFLQTDTLMGKIQRLGKVSLILKPIIKVFLSILDSEQTPEEIKNDNRFILGTLNKMVLIIDLTEDYYIQKKAAETAGIKDFQYQYKIIKPNDSFDDYDPETSRARVSPTQREREYASEQYDIFDFLQDSLKRKSLSYLISESEEDIVDEEVEAEGEELEEFSGVGAVAGFTLPLGASPRGPKGEHSSTTGGKAYPYSSSDRSKFNKFSKKTFGGK